MNNRKPHFFDHALCAEDLVIAGECPASLDQLRASLCEEHQPATTTECMLVNEIAEQFWRIRRMRACETRGMQPDNIDASFETGLLAFVARNMAAAERGLHKAITTLRRLQADRGFVPSKAKEPAPAPAEHPESVAASEQVQDSAPPSDAPDETLDFGDLDVANILAGYDKDLHPFVLEDLALLQAQLRRRKQAA